MHKTFYRTLEHLLRDIDDSAGDEEMLNTVVARLVEGQEAAHFGIASGRVYRERALDYVLIESIGEYGEAIEGKTVRKDYPPVRNLLEKRHWVFSPESPGWNRDLEEQFSHLNNAAIAVGQNPTYILSFSVDREDNDELLIMLESIRAAIGLKLRQGALESQLRQAQTIQSSLLPQRIPELEGIEIAARTLPAEEVGGDVYDVQTLDAGMLGLLLADASGHGLPAALQARDVVVGMRMGQTHNEKITSQVQRLNQVVHRTLLTSRFITLFYAEIEDTGNVTYVNAGHCPPLLFTNADEVFRLQVSGPVLGPLPDSVYRRCYMTLRPGEMLVLFTDGLLERNAPGEEADDEHEGVEFGEENVIRVCREHRDAGPGTVADALISAVRRFGGDAPLADDMTVVVVKRRLQEGEKLQESLVPVDLVDLDRR